MTINMFKQLCTKILINEGLNDWTIRYNTGGGLCVFSCKEIWMDAENKMNLSLFLHEVAHALCPEEEYLEFYKIDKTGHFSIWGDHFTALVKRYMCAKSDKIEHNMSITEMLTGKKNEF